MGKFNKSGGREMPPLNTSSLPDLIFTLLFFFMMVTTMREVTLKVDFRLPQATELQKLEKKSLITFIYMGKPTNEFRAKMGSETDRLGLTVRQTNWETGRHTDLEKGRQKDRQTHRQKDIDRQTERRVERLDHRLGS